jgi:hypothetical protein
MEDIKIGGLEMKPRAVLPRFEDFVSFEGL